MLTEPLFWLGVVAVASVGAYIGYRLGYGRVAKSAALRWEFAVERLRSRIADAEREIGDRYMGPDQISFCIKDLEDAKQELALLEQRIKVEEKDWSERVRLALNVYGRTERVIRMAQDYPSKTRVAVPAPSPAVASREDAASGEAKPEDSSKSAG